jgi:hypothetical protein
MDNRSAHPGTPMQACKGTQAAMVHFMIEDTSRLPLGEPAKMSSFMIDAVPCPAPKRITLGKGLKRPSCGDARNQFLRDGTARAVIAFTLSSENEYTMALPTSPSRQKLR